MEKIKSMCRISISLDDVKGIFRTLVNEELNSIFENLEIKYLNKSYRTSIEIMNEANKIT